MCWAEGPALDYSTRHQTTTRLQQPGHFRNNKKCQLENVLGRRPSTPRLHKAPNYNTPATINALGPRQRVAIKKCAGLKALLNKAPNNSISVTPRTLPQQQ